MARCETDSSIAAVDPGEMDAVKFGKPEDWTRPKMKHNFGRKGK
jgi:hypothetical protein